MTNWVLGESDKLKGSDFFHKLVLPRMRRGSKQPLQLPTHPSTQSLLSLLFQSRMGGNKPFTTSPHPPDRQRASKAANISPLLSTPRAQRRRKLNLVSLKRFDSNFICRLSMLPLLPFQLSPGFTHLKRYDSKFICRFSMPLLQIPFQRWKTGVFAKTSEKNLNDSGG